MPNTTRSPWPLQNQTQLYNSFIDSTVCSQTLLLILKYSKLTKSNELYHTIHIAHMGHVPSTHLGHQAIPEFVDQNWLPTLSHNMNQHNTSS